MLRERGLQSQLCTYLVDEQHGFPTTQMSCSALHADSAPNCVDERILLLRTSSDSSAGKRDATISRSLSELSWMYSSFRLGSGSARLFRSAIRLPLTRSVCTPPLCDSDQPEHWREIEIIAIQGRRAYRQGGRELPLERAEVIAPHVEVLELGEVRQIAN